MRYRNLLLFIVYCLLSTAFICGCATIYNPATEKKEFIFINTRSEVSLGKVIAKQIELKYSLSDDKKKMQRLLRIGARLASVSDRQDLRYQFKVVEDKELNAFSLPGGLVYVNSGLMDKATDDELACVVAHEIGHIAAKHAIKKLQVSLGYQIITNLAFRKASSLELYRAVNTTFGLISLGYSREDERLSDRLAVKYAFYAKFDPNGMVTFFKKLKEEQKKRGINYHIVFLQSHPAIDERINNVKKEMEIIKNKVNNPIDTPGLQKISQSEIKTTSQNINAKNNETASGGPKKCPECNRIYSKNYKFCIKDGTKLMER